MDRRRLRSEISIDQPDVYPLLIASPNDLPGARDSPDLVARKRTLPGAHNAIAPALLFQSPSRLSSRPESAACRVRFLSLPEEFSSSAIHIQPASACTPS